MIRVPWPYSSARMSSISLIYRPIWKTLQQSQQPIWGLDSILRQRLEEVIMGCREDQWKEYIHSHLDIHLKEQTLMNNSIRKTRSLLKWFCPKLSLENLMTSISLRTHLKFIKQLKKCWYSEKSKENLSSLNLSRTRLSTSTCMDKILWNHSVKWEALLWMCRDPRHQQALPPIELEWSERCQRSQLKRCLTITEVRA